MTQTTLANFSKSLMHSPRVRKMIISEQRSLLKILTVTQDSNLIFEIQASALLSLKGLASNLLVSWGMRVRIIIQGTPYIPYKKH